jgi:hypothetical protein
LSFNPLFAAALSPADSGEKGFFGKIAELWQAFQNSTQETLGPPLKSLHQPIDDWLGSLPMSVAMFCAIGLFVLAGIWVWTLKSDFIFRGAPDRSRWRDLRIWSMIVLLPYISIYLLFGR